MSDIYEDVARQALRDGKATRMTEPIASAEPIPGREAWLQHLRDVRASIARNRDDLRGKADRFAREAEGLTVHLRTWDQLIVDQEAEPTTLTPTAGDSQYDRGGVLLSGKQRNVPGADSVPGTAPGGNGADR